MVIRPPAVDATEPTVAIALTVAPSAAPAATVARPSAYSLAMVASEASAVLQTGAGASATGCETLAAGGRDGQSGPQASRTERAIGPARRSGNPAASATILPGLTRRSRKGFDRRRNVSLHCARSIPP